MVPREPYLPSLIDYDSEAISDDSDSAPGVFDNGSIPARAAAESSYSVPPDAGAEDSAHIATMSPVLSSQDFPQDGSNHSLLRLRELRDSLCQRYATDRNLADLNELVDVQRKMVDIIDSEGGDASRAVQLYEYGSTLQKLFNHSQSPADLDLTTVILQEAADLIPKDHPLCACLSDAVGSTFFCRFEMAGATDDLDKAVSAYQLAVNLTPPSHSHRYTHLEGLGYALHAQYERYGHQPDLDHSIDIFQEVMDHLRPVERRLSCLMQVGGALHARGEDFRSVADLTKAIDIFQKAVDLLPACSSSQARKASVWNNLNVAVQSRFMLSHSSTDLDWSINIVTQLIDLTPDESKEKSCLFHDLGTSLLSRFKNQGNTVDLDSAVTALWRASNFTGFTPDEHLHMAEHLSDLGHALQDRFSCFHVGSDLDDAIAILDQAIKFTPDRDPNEGRIFHQLSVLLRTRFERTGMAEDIDQSLSLSERAIALAPNTRADKPCRIHSRGISYHTRFTHINDLTDLTNSINYFQHAVDLTNPDHPHYDSHLDALVLSLQGRFQRLGHLEDLNRCVAALERAVNSFPVDHPRRITSYCNLGLTLRKRFESAGSTSDINDLQRSITVLLAGTATMADNTSHKDSYLCGLSSALRLRFERLDDLKDLDASIEASQQAMKLMTDGHSHMLPHLRSLGALFRQRYNRTNILADLDTSVALLQQAVEMIPLDHPQRAVHYASFGASLHTRFDRLGVLADLEKSIANYQLAVAISATEDDAQKRSSSFLDGLGRSLHTRFQRLRNPDDLDKSISMSSQAVELTPMDDKIFACRLNSLGTSIHTRYEHGRAFEDFEQSAASFQQAVDLLPDTDAEKAGHLNNLASVYQGHFEHSHRPEDLDKAIECLQSAIRLTPKWHYLRAGYLDNLGEVLGIRFQLSRASSDLQDALDAHMEGAEMVGSLPSCRFASALSYARLCRKHKPVHSALDGYKRVLDFMPPLVWLGQNIQDRYAGLHAISDVANEAAAVAISAGDFAAALEWLEEGRCIVWGQILQLRTPLDDLRDAHPSLATELDEVSRKLHEAGAKSVGHAESANPHANLNVQMERDVQEQHRLAERYEALLTETRRRQGFEGFLKPRKMDELRQAAQSRVVVVINVHELQCDALVLASPSDEVRHVPLRKINYGMAVKLHAGMRRLLKESHIRERGVRAIHRVKPKATSSGGSIGGVLARLWELVVEPILSVVDPPLSKEIDNLTHISWCATGPLSFLPLHAAGLYNSSNDPKVYDRVVSSYTPTLSSLIRERRAFKVSAPSLLAISQPNTANQQPLPFTVNEIKAAEGCFTECGLSCQWLSDKSATKESVLSAMANHSWVHLACHAIQHPLEPTESAFLLDGSQLKLIDIMAMSFMHTELAVLSACQTAKGDADLAEEAVHLAAGMLMAGYGSVIATMWSIRDRDAPEVMERFYSYLLNKVGGDSDTSQSAYALHYAVQLLRDRLDDDENALINWVPYIHIGF